MSNTEKGFEDFLADVYDHVFEIRTLHEKYSSEATHYHILKDNPEFAAKYAEFRTVEDTERKARECEASLAEAIDRATPLVERAELFLGRVHAPKMVSCPSIPWLEATCWPVWLLEAIKVKEPTKKQQSIIAEGRSFGVLTHLTPGVRIDENKLTERCVQEGRAAIDLWREELPATEDDDSAFVDAATLRKDCPEFTRADQLTRFLQQVNRDGVVIRTKKPSRNRLLIHSGDWHRYRQLQESGPDALDRNAEEIDRILADINARKQAERYRKR
jgi:hypothetical protein